MALSLTPNRPALCSLPPECLLSIISYLPSTSYTPLVQTSHHFLRFFSTHSSTICNTYILSHYSLSASYLGSTYVDGWLVPSHPAVQIQEQKLLFPPALHIFNIPVPGKILLSSPGPQYLKFLEQYDFEIRTRREMADRELAKLDNEATLSDNDVPKAVDLEKNDMIRGENEQESKEQKIEDRFTYMVGTYAIRGFLRKLDDLAESLGEKRVQEARTRFDECLDENQGRGQRAHNMARKAGLKLTNAKERLRSTITGMKKSLQKEKRHLCFGEIESLDSTEKIGLEAPLRDGMEGLLWYYGDVGVSAFQKQGVRFNTGARHVESQSLWKANGPGEKRVDRVKQGVQKVLVNIAKVTTCFGRKRHFEALD